MSLCIALHIISSDEGSERDIQMPLSAGVGCPWQVLLCSMETTNTIRGSVVQYLLKRSMQQARARPQEEAQAG